MGKRNRTMATEQDWYARRESWTFSDNDARSAADVDYARVVHSASFRRLQGKTQILNLGDSDFYRTRLTHSLEVAQIAGGIARQLSKKFSDHAAQKHLPDLSLIQAIGFTHDLGHPPFGHGGEVALNYCMRDNGGFEGNGQTLRILSKLEKFSEAAGSNLTRRTLLGVLKYPVPYSRAFNSQQTPKLDPTPTTVRIIDRKSSKPPKCYMDCEQDVVDWVLAPLSIEDRERFSAIEDGKNKHHKARYKSFDCSIMDLADDISFGVHDLEDALALRLIDEGQFRKHVPEEKCTSVLAMLSERYPGEFGNNVYDGFVEKLFSGGQTRKHFISRILNHLIPSCKIETIEEFSEPLIRYKAVMETAPSAFLEALKDVVREIVILSPSVQHLEFKGQKMVVSVFETFTSEPKALLPRDTFDLYKGSADKQRVISDHISGMTDGFLLKTYDRLFSPHMGSVFDKL
jgi:dGTPase